MGGKCEICSATSNLTKVYMCGCDEESPATTLCEDCKKKYFDYIRPTHGIFGVPDLIRVEYIPWLSYADNLVYAYNVRFGNHQEMKKEKTTMQVTYNGFTGELVKLEKKETGRYTVTPYDTAKHPEFGYDISIYDREKNVTHSFTGVKLEDVKFSGGAVSFSG